MTKIGHRLEILAIKGKEATLNLTEPGAPIMKGKKGNFDTFYNVQVGCCENQLITYNAVVTAGNDKAQLVPALKGISLNTGQKIEQALADADYGTLDSFEYMDTHGITGYVPYREMNNPFAGKPFHSSHFKYDPERNVYTCPQGQALAFYRKTEDKERKQVFDYYRAPDLQTCKQCPFREQCAGKRAARRVIKREVRQHLREQMKERLSSAGGKAIYNKRLHPVEAIFGHLKLNLGYQRFLLRGLDKVNAELNIMSTAFNLRKIICLMTDLFKAQSTNKKEMPLGSFLKLGTDKILSRLCQGTLVGLNYFFLKTNYEYKNC